MTEPTPDTSDLPPDAPTLRRMNRRRSLAFLVILVAVLAWAFCPKPNPGKPVPVSIDLPHGVRLVPVSAPTAD